jgi:thiosulfate/3-mercaptopyruvate sulfurtransferase
VAPGTQVVALDRNGGMYAARLWWMLRWLGHGEVAVLDGGYKAWVASGGVPQTEPVARIDGAQPYPERPSLVASIDAAALSRRLGQADGARCPLRRALSAAKRSRSTR